MDANISGWVRAKSRAWSDRQQLVECCVTANPKYYTGFGRLCSHHYKNAATFLAGESRLPDSVPRLLRRHLCRSVSVRLTSRLRFATATSQCNAPHLMSKFALSIYSSPCCGTVTLFACLITATSRVRPERAFTSWSGSHLQQKGSAT